MIRTGQKISMCMEGQDTDMEIIGFDQYYVAVRNEGEVLFIDRSVFELDLAFQSYVIGMN